MRGHVPDTLLLCLGLLFCNCFVFLWAGPAQLPPAGDSDIFMHKKKTHPFCSAKNALSQAHTQFFDPAIPGWSR